MKTTPLTVFIVLFACTSFAKVWQVGPTRTYTVPSAVENLVSNGDTVEIDAGIYNDCATWNNNNLLLKGMGTGYAHLENAVCGSKGIWVLYGTGITVENMEFSGAVIGTALGGNGAGVRAQGGSFTIRNCYFHDNQDGILENPADSMTDILFENSIFEFNGCDTGSRAGFDHNIYIGNARSFTMRFCYTHGAIIGHEIKTRAFKNYILYNRIMDDSNGTASRDMDIPNGGQAIIMGNIIEKGPNAPNSDAIEFGLEGFVNPGPQNIYLINNTFVNDRSTCGFLDLETGTDTLQFINNIVAGPNTTFSIGAAPSFMDSATNWIAANTAGVGLINPAKYNYQLLPSSAAINKGSVAGHYDTLSFIPQYVYVDSANEKPRVITGTIDIGAYEYNPPKGIDNLSNPSRLSLKIYPTPATDELTVAITNTENPEGIHSDKLVSLVLLDITGREIMSFSTAKSLLTLNTSSLAPGIYMLKAVTENATVNGKVVIEK